MILEKNETDVQKAKKLYKKDKSQNGIKIATFVVILIFVAFFTSNLYLPASLNAKSEATKKNEVNSFATERSFKLLKAEYSKKQEILAVIFEVENNSFDGVDQYFYAVNLEGASTRGINIRPVVEDPLLNVVIIIGVKKFDEADLYFAPKKGKIENVKDEDTGTIVLNKYNLDYMTIDTSKTKRDYLVEKFDLSIADLKKDIEKREKSVDALQKRIDGLNQRNEEIKKSYEFMTESEKEDAEVKISENENAVSELESQISSKNNSIEKKNKQLDEAEEQKRALYEQ